MLLPILIALVAIVAFGVWRRFGAVQWIWLLFGAAIALVLVWVAMLAFVIGPEMRRRAPSAPEPRAPIGEVVPGRDGPSGAPAAPVGDRAAIAAPPRSRPA